MNPPQRKQQLLLLGQREVPLAVMAKQRPNVSEKLLHRAFGQAEPFSGNDRSSRRIQYLMYW